MFNKFNLGNPCGSRYPFQSFSEEKGFPVLSLLHFPISLEEKFPEKYQINVIIVESHFFL